MAEEKTEPKYERALVISAHPDDPEFGQGGTVAKLASEGVEITYVVCTDGSEGGEDPALPDEELTQLRYREQREAAAILGVSEVVFLGLPDGRLTPSIDLRHELTRQIRRFRPDIVFTHNPVISLAVPIGAYHPDHLAVGQATLAAVYPASRNPRAFRALLDEGLQPWRVREVWIGSWVEGDYYVDISSVIEKKVASIMAHQSQTANWKDMEKNMRERHASAKDRSGFEYTEIFRRILTP